MARDFRIKFVESLNFFAPRIVDAIGKYGGQNFRIKDLFSTQLSSSGDALILGSISGSNNLAIGGNAHITGAVSAASYGGDGSGLSGVMINWVLEDGDGTEVTVSNGKEVKFVEGTGIDIDWTDVSDGSDADPYDLTFTCNLEGTELISTGETAGTKFLREDGDGTCSWQSSGGTITALNNQAENRLVTIGSTTTELDGEANITYDGTTFSVDDAAVFNDSGNDNDFRVESADQAHALYVDAGNNEIQINSRTANATGGGFDGAASVTLYVSKVNGEIITTILVDIEGLVVSGTAFDIIGENSVAAAYITRITTAVNGIIYRAEMACIEAPAGTNTTADIDLGSSSSSKAEDQKYTQGGGAIQLIAAGEAWTAGMHKATPAATNFSGLADDYLYLANGSGANSGGTYTAGKFIIKLYGAGF